MPKTTSGRGRTARSPRRALARLDAMSGDVLDHYIAEAERVPVRSSTEQKELARVMRDPARSAQERAQARESLITANIRFAFSIAKRYQHRGLELEDLVAEANAGLLRAADKYDPDVGVNFISYAVWWIRQAILAAIATQSRTVRVPLNRSGDLARIARARQALEQVLGREPTPDEIGRAAERTPELVKDLLGVMQSTRSLDEPLWGRSGPGDGETLGTVVADTAAEGSSDTLPGGVEETSRREALDQALNTLSPRDARVLRLYYGLEGEPPMTLEQISQMLGVTRERVRQLRDRALAALRQGGNAHVLRQEWAA